jgi:hypothetical protein
LLLFLLHQPRLKHACTEESHGTKAGFKRNVHFTEGQVVYLPLESVATLAKDQAVGSVTAA